VPYWHETLYTLKTALNGSLLKRINIPILRYGHCNFKSSEALAAFAILVLRSGGLSLKNVEKVLPNAAVRADYDQLVNQYLSGKLPKAR
jgi:hypothetical protein